MPEPGTVTVVGGGNAGLCAAISAAEAGAHAVLLDWAPAERASTTSTWCGATARTPSPAAA